jgi:hypothetical protein
MKRKTIAITALAASLAAGGAQATCIYPRAPERIPDGKTASYEEMVATQQAVRQFNEDINAYNVCLDLEMASLEQSGLYDANRLLELRSMQAKKNNAAVDELEGVAEQFNEQLRIFKAREKSD